MENNVFFNFNSVSSMSNYNTRGTLNPPYTYSPNYTVASRIYNFDRNNPQNNIDPLQSYKILVTNAFNSSDNLYIYSSLDYTVETTTLEAPITDKAIRTIETGILKAIVNELVGTAILSLKILSIVDNVTGEILPIPDGVTYAFDKNTAILSVTIPDFRETYRLSAQLISSITVESSITGTKNLNVGLYYS